MNRKQTAIIAFLLVAAFGVGALIGHRSGRLGSHTTHRASEVAIPDESVPCVGVNEAKIHVGEVGCVNGRVMRVFTSRAGNTFLDFCEDYRNCPFTTVIFSTERGKFGNLESLRGREVEIRGRIEAYQGRAEIIIQDPRQIRVSP
jgi:hypothetical protein